MGAAAIPIALAGASLVATNVGNKAAIKNNETQQAAAVGNSQQAWKGAQDAVNGWLTKNPEPFAGATVKGPTPGAYGQGGLQAPTSYDQSLAPFVSAILGAAPSQPSAPAPMPMRPPVPAPPSQPTPTGGHTRSLLSANPLVARILAGGMSQRMAI